MGRLPFDPNRMRRAKQQAEGGRSAPASPSEANAASAAEGVLSVSRLAALIRGVLDEGLPRKVRVVGEITGARRSTHLYLALKDGGAVISAVLFASQLKKLQFDPRDGQEVVATGRVEFYEPQGRVSLIIEKLEPVGEGAAEARFRQLCEELRTLGWFAPERKRPLPTFPRRVAVVTSPTGAALQDVLITMAKRCPAVAVAVVPVRVQGESAAREVVRAIDFVSREHERLGIDAVVVTRGGGSPEDLAAFNDREVARAIVDCRIPVVAAIGHETDTSIAELVADEPRATPTQAAMRLTPDREALGRQLDALSRRFRTDLARTLRYEHQRLAAASRHPVLADPRGATRLGAGATRDRPRRSRRRRPRARWPPRPPGLIGCGSACTPRIPAARWRPPASRLDARAARLLREVTHRFDMRRAAAASLGERLEAIGPGAVLRRGYSCTLRADGTAARDAADLVPGERLTTYLAPGVGRGRCGQGLGRRPRHPGPNARKAQGLEPAGEAPREASPGNRPRGRSVGPLRPR
ncbi:MAG: exodeoxyribonuclease VII large subunit [Planctomycetota bacterium]|nr:MAG: exodeoxyribonuclease VII large subunit [Planctomycetota bacterium]